MSDVPDRLYDLPPSAKLVFKVLEINGDLTQSQIADKSRLSRRTVRHALATLEEADAVHKGVYFQDARQSLYSLPESIASENSSTERSVSSL